MRRITQSLTVFTALDKFRSMFQIVLVGFFFLFSLPIFFITILVSLLLTERIISPITHLEDATRRVAEGDFGFRILTRFARRACHPRGLLQRNDLGARALRVGSSSRRRGSPRGRRSRSAWPTRSGTPSRRSSSPHRGY